MVREEDDELMKKYPGYKIVYLDINVYATKEELNYFDSCGHDCSCCGDDCCCEDDDCECGCEDDECECHGHHNEECSCNHEGLKHSKSKECSKKDTDKNKK